MDLSATDILQFLGPLGISLNSKPTDAPDPWSMTDVKKVFVGESSILNTSDLWTSKMQSIDPKSQLLNAPGTKDPITGVLPVRSLSPDGYDLMYKYAPTLLKLHISGSLRGSLVSIPFDYGALLSACASRLAVQFVDDGLHATAEFLFHLMKDLNFSKNRGEI